MSNTTMKALHAEVTRELSREEPDLQRVREATSLMMLEAGPPDSMLPGIIEKLAESGTLRAIPALRGLTKGLWRSAKVKNAAAEAIRAIEARHGASHAGALSVAQLDTEGRLSEVDECGLEDGGRVSEIQEGGGGSR